MSHKYLYEVSPECGQKIFDVVAMFGSSFVKRHEKALVLTCDRPFSSVYCTISTLMLVHRRDCKALDVVLRFSVGNSAADSGDESEAMDALQFTEVKTAAPPSSLHLPFNPHPAEANSITLGQLDHFGDVEVLRHPQLKAKLIGEFLRLDLIEL